MSEDKFKVFREKVGSVKLQKNTTRLKTYTGEPINISGIVSVKVAHQQQTKNRQMVVVARKGPCLLGRDWLNEIKVNWGQVKYMQSNMLSLNSVLQMHETVFKEKLGKLKGTTVVIHVEENATPKFYRPRSVPYAMRAKVDDEIKRLQKEGVLKPVKYSEWTAPVVLILKRDGKTRLCGDYKMTVNQVASLEQYPIPHVEDLFMPLTGGKTFSKLDMSHAYQQIRLDEHSQKYVTINTLKGLYTYTLGCPRHQQFSSAPWKMCCRVCRRWLSIETIF